jgi:hypothetical protein
MCAVLGVTRLKDSPCVIHLLAADVRTRERLLDTAAASSVGGVSLRLPPYVPLAQCAVREG